MSGNSLLFANKVVNGTTTTLSNFGNTATPVRSLDVLNSDTFLGNNSGGTALAWGTLSVDQFDQGGGKLQLPVGTWDFAVTGSVKDVATSTSGTINVAAQVKLLGAQSCLTGN